MFPEPSPSEFSVIITGHRVCPSSPRFKTSFNRKTSLSQRDSGGGSCLGRKKAIGFEKSHFQTLFFQFLRQSPGNDRLPGLISGRSYENRMHGRPPKRTPALPTSNIGLLLKRWKTGTRHIPAESRRIIAKEARSVNRAIPSEFGGAGKSKQENQDPLDQFGILKRSANLYRKMKIFRQNPSIFQSAI